MALKIFTQLAIISVIYSLNKNFIRGHVYISLCKNSSSYSYTTKTRIYVANVARNKFTNVMLSHKRLNIDIVMLRVKLVYNAHTYLCMLHACNACILHIKFAHVNYNV